MAKLELRVPPDVVAIGVGVAMWGIAKLTPGMAMANAVRFAIAILLSVAGTALIVAGRVAFARAGTTFSPVAPERSVRLVTSGIYRRTRNPMYLGTLLLLLALAAWWRSPWAAIVAFAFMAYMNRFQITPEERMLRARFGTAFEQYAARVRRWI